VRLPKNALPGAKGRLELLLSGPVLRNLLFFLCIAMANGGIQTFSVVALGALHDTPAAVATWACRVSCCSAPPACWSGHHRRPHAAP